MPKSRRKRTSSGGTAPTPTPSQFNKLSEIPVKPQPAREQVAIKDLRPSVRVGWLTVLNMPGNGLSPVLCRCVCGAVVAPRARYVSEGKWLTCGLVLDPHNGSGHGWTGIPAPVPTAVHRAGTPTPVLAAA